MSHILRHPVTEIIQYRSMNHNQQKTKYFLRGIIKISRIYISQIAQYSKMKQSVHERISLKHII